MTFLSFSFPLFYLFPPPLSFYLFLFLLFLHLLFFLRILHLSHPSFLHSMIFSYKIQNIKPVNSIRDVCSLPSCSPFFLKSKSFSRSVMSNSLPPWTVAHQLHCPWNSSGKKLEWVAILFSKRIFPTQGSNPGLLHCRQTL